MYYQGVLYTPGRDFLGKLNINLQLVTLITAVISFFFFTTASATRSFVASIGVRILARIWWC